MENKPTLTKEKFLEIQKKFFNIYKKGKYIFRHNNPNFYFNKWKFLSITPVKIKQRKDRKIKFSVHLYYSNISSEYVNPFEDLNLDSKNMSKDLYDKYNRYILLHNIGSISGKNKKSQEKFKRIATKDIQDSYNKEKRNKLLKNMIDKIEDNNKILVKKSFDEMKKNKNDNNNKIDDNNKNKNFNDNNNKIVDDNNKYNNKIDDNNEKKNKNEDEIINNDNNVYENENNKNKIETTNIEINDNNLNDNNNNNNKLRSKKSLEPEQKIDENHKFDKKYY